MRHPEKKDAAARIQGHIRAIKSRQVTGEMVASDAAFRVEISSAFRAFKAKKERRASMDEEEILIEMKSLQEVNAFKAKRDPQPCSFPCLLSRSALPFLKEINLRHTEKNTACMSIQGAVRGKMGRKSSREISSFKELFQYEISRSRRRNSQGEIINNMKLPGTDGDVMKAEEAINREFSHPMLGCTGDMSVMNFTTIQFG